ncbi:uncharacterized protein MELLADRAFT_86188 [Melampsora larici-populina 98AG31]|uniref:Vacuolar membrane-associated protein IML1 n=1 Tax=Melampsora larici-populina (strain 98AG31 / pathotype 3-4-7) TaxID=747676 RepID=F4RKV8_MELLP|nr:uncharacterized protein MELLADRAFT_86188 [Melampsora larici-populina 98AG31]EGG06793.1 hypothetical protein MELLADRAFT_86188 [Melampsora larici-populina 98AG31]
MVHPTFESFRLTLWIDPEPTQSFPAGVDLADAASGIRLNLAALDPSSIGIGDLLEIVPLLNPVASTAEHSFATPDRWDNEPGFLFIVRHHTLVRQQGLQISIPIGIAKAFDLEKYNRNEVLIRKVPSPTPSAYCADHVELVFRDQYIGRGEMWRMTMMLNESVAWVGRDVSLAMKIKTKVARVYVKGNRVLAGYITPFTKIIFRSESAKYYLYIQMSSEMWTFEEDGSLYHEKAILFLEDLFSRWNKIGCNHLVTIVLFARVFYDEKDVDQIPEPVLIGDDGRAYKDFYKAFVHSQKVLDHVREDISKFQQRTLTYTDSAGATRLAGQISYAPEGNILEAMSTACNSFDEHYIDRDLHRTGVSIVFVTAGTCVYHANQMLLRLATERFVAHGLGVDYVSLSKIPLHVVPLFRFSALDLDHYQSPRRSGQDLNTSHRLLDPSMNPIYLDAPTPQAKKTTYYVVPFFVDCSFFSRHQDRPFRIDRFMPRCRMPQIQNGIGEHDMSGISIPYLHEAMPPGATDDDAQRRKKARQIFDAGVVEASPGPLLSRRAKKEAAQLSSTRAVIDHLVLTPIEPKRRIASSKHEEINRSPLLKATIPDGSRDFSQLANQPSAGLSTMPISGSRSRATSASTTESNQATTGAPALLARLAGLAQPSRTLWPWSSVTGSSSTKPSRNVSTASTARQSSPPESVYLNPTDDGSSQRTGSRASSVTRGFRELRSDTIRSGQSDSIRPATNLMPLMNTPKRITSASTIGRDSRTVESSLRSPEIKKTSLPRQRKKFNPSNPNGSSSGLLSQYRCWSAIFPRPPNDQRSLKWKSLTTPGCLPITTDFSPSQEELNTSYALTEYEYLIAESSVLVKTPDPSLTPQEASKVRAASTLREAISQRLSQGFQLVIPELPLHVTELAPTLRPRWLSMEGILHEAEKGQGAYVDVSLSDHYHRVSIKRLETGSPTLLVQIYVRKRAWLAEAYLYRPAVWWSTEWPGWHEFDLKFEFPDLDSFDFKALDGIIVGNDYGLPLSESLRYWRTRIVFLPDSVSPLGSKAQNNADATIDETRVAGMMKMQMHLRNLTWLPISDLPKDGLALDFSSSDASIHVRQEAERFRAFTSAYRGQREKLGRVLSLRDPLNVIVEAMMNTAHGVDVKPQSIQFTQLRMVDNVFMGDKFVTFLKHHFNFSTREEALKFGRQLELRGLFKDAYHHPPKALIDGPRYYQLNTDLCPPKPSRTWFGRASTSTVATSNSVTPTSSTLTVEKVTDKLNASNLSSRPSSSAATVSNVGVSEVKSRRSSSVSRSRAERPQITMTRSGIIDLDPTGRSERSEKVILHCDLSHSTLNAWHLEIQWLGISSNYVENLIQQWTRIIERYSIKVIEESVRSLESVLEFSPFQNRMELRLSFKPNLELLNGCFKRFEPLPTVWRVSKFDYFEGQLLRSLGFVLDVSFDETNWIREKDWIFDQGLWD